MEFYSTGETKFVLCRVEIHTNKLILNMQLLLILSFYLLPVKWDISNRRF